MTKPTKIPVSYAVSALNSSNRGYEHRPDDVSYQELVEIAVNDGLLVPVSKLLKYFAHYRAFEEFKNNLWVPEKFWNSAIRISPAIKKYARRFMPAKQKGRPRTRRRSKLVSKLGSFSDSELSDVDSDTSILSITPSNDELDDTDVNLPLPVCKGIRRICREYDSRRRYLPYKKDSSENKQYHFKISYDS